MAVASNPDQIREQWRARLTDLIGQIQNWASDLGWTTRQIDVSVDDSELGRYSLPALLIQEGGIRILVEPVTHSAPGADGVVDLYLMPGYDDIASLYSIEGDWKLHYMFPGTSAVATIRDAESKSLTCDSLREVLDEMKKNAV
ncbi:MAG: hypothetical protein KDA69_14870 [Planctomycetaceae bacterium]|nr:hypothetical protein [Planctomycetaceae bacterium]